MAGKPTAEESPIPWRDRMTKERMAAAETQRETGTTMAAPSSRDRRPG